MLGGERGQYVFWAELDQGLRVTGGAQKWLDDSVADDPELARLVARHRAETTRLGDEFAKEAVATFRSEGRVGSESCKECHQAEHSAWASSKHAHAMQTLKRKGQHRNADCLTCHFQDVPSQGRPDIESVAGIGCEACHGGGSRHVEVRRRNPRGVSLGLFKTASPGSCVVCHDKENSKNFSFATYWPRMQHGVRGLGRDDK